jgi:hypothetical protein
VNFKACETKLSEGPLHDPCPYLCRAESANVSSEGLEPVLFNNNSNTNNSSKKARIPPTTDVVTTTENEVTGKDDFNISNTPNVAPTEIRRRIMRLLE